MSDDGLLHREEQRAFRRWTDITHENHVFVAPIISFAAFVVIGIGDRSIWTGVIALLLQIALFQIAVTAHIRHLRLRHFVFIFAPFVVIGSLALIGIITSTVGTDWGRAIAAIFSAALTAGVIIRIFGRVVDAPVVDRRTVINAITVYLMIGLLFSYIFLAVAALDGGEFFVQGRQPTTTYLYFSYITLATIGYGDFTPAHTAGRFLAVAEGLMGQLYLVTILAVIVSNLGAKRKPPSESGG